MPRPRKGGDISAIFVHAGAGFHSQSNERAHLETCENAVKVAMSMLKNGASAVDAVEIAIMVLEDSEITNSGFGSNLTIDGGVECDAMVIDHKGRSGAVGAVAHVKNPISLARVILESSARPLSLQRVPPNFLVGPGATDFAYEQGLVILPLDGLVSEGARERWHRWHRDLQAAELHEREEHPARYQDSRINAFFRRPAYNPAQAFATPPRTGSSPHDDKKPFAGDSCDPSESQEAIESPTTLSSQPYDLNRVDPTKFLDGAASQVASSTGQTEEACNESPSASCRQGRADQISDTVGAIAVDCHGNIAAGSSSGGIGMKHRGRIGPAALVGIGAAVMPADPADPDKTSVASVTSGTGEHIATTLAANTCAARVYYNERKVKDGTFEEVTEDEAMRAMIDVDFMDHPGVKSSHCQGAIGVLTVKKTVNGVHLYFGHNTDSFALASMSSEDKKPMCVMSRSAGNGSIAQGGRSCRYKRYKILRAVGDGLK